MTKRGYRIMQNLLALLTLSVLFFSFYFQYAKGFQPCPLCMMQRLCACGLMFFCLVGLALKSLKRAKYVTLLMLLLSTAGLFFACRQLWLQSLPSTGATVCMPGIDMLIRYFPWRELLPLFLWGSNTCGDVTWSSFGLSMAAWSAVYFSVMISFCGIVLARLMMNTVPSDHVV